MEMNLTKGILNLWDNISEITAEQVVDTDFTLPDYLPKIERILICSLSPRILSKSVENDKLCINGSAYVRLIYTDESNGIFSYEYETPFEKNIDITAWEDGTVIALKCITDFANCRAIGERKMDIHGAFSMKISLKKNIAAEIISDIDFDGAQIKSGACPATNPLGYAEKTTVIEEELLISDNDEQINTIIRYDVSPVISGTEVIGSKIMVKGDLAVTALYTTETASPKKYETRIPFNQVLELDTKGTDCRADAEMEILSSYLRIRTAADGKTVGFGFECRAIIKVTATCENDLPVIFDAFSTKQMLNFDYKDVKFNKLEASYNPRYLCKKTLDFSENTFGTVIDMWCTPNEPSSKMTNDGFSVNGTVTVSLLTYDTDGKPQFLQKTVDYNYSQKTDIDGKNLYCIAKPSVLTSEYTIIGDDKLEIRIELIIGASVYSETTEKVLVGAAIGDGEVSKKRAPVVVYYAEKGENVWDIAKRYNSCCMDIMSINKLDAEEILKSEKLLIP